MPYDNPLSQTADGIESLIDEWLPRLKELDSTLVHVKPSPERWSISEVIGHLIDSACNNHQRFVRAQFCDGELAFPKYDQNEWVVAANYQTFDWPMLIQLWHNYNHLIAAVIRNISPTVLATRCTITPYETCTLEFLANDYLTHLQHHFGILQERLSQPN